jgi:hypothetical protein
VTKEGSQPIRWPSSFIVIGAENDEARMTNDEGKPRSYFVIRHLVIVSGFVIRISSFLI